MRKEKQAKFKLTAPLSAAFALLLTTVTPAFAMTSITNVYQGGEGAYTPWSCYPSNGLGFASIQSLQNVQDSYTEAMTKMGKVVNEGQNEAMQAQKSVMEAMINEMIDVMKKTAVAEETQKHMAQMASGCTCPQSTSGDSAAQTASYVACQQQQTAATIDGGIAQANAQAAAIKAGVDQYNDSAHSENDINNRLANQTGPDTSASTLFATGSVGASGQYPTAQTLANYQANIINPRPVVQLNALSKNTAASKQFSAFNAINNANLSLPNQALALIGRNQASATIPADYYVQQWKDMGAKGTPPGVSCPSGSSISSDGTCTGAVMSPDAAISAGINARFANPSWYSYINDGDPNLGTQDVTTNDLREINRMGAIQTRIDMENYNLLQYMASLMASDYSNQVVQSGALAKVNAMRANASIQSVFSSGASK